MRAFLAGLSEHAGYDAPLLLTAEAQGPVGAVVCLSAAGCKIVRTTREAALACCTARCRERSGSAVSVYHMHRLSRMLAMLRRDGGRAARVRQDRRGGGSGPAVRRPSR